VCVCVCVCECVFFCVLSKTVSFASFLFLGRLQ
jgi:hypothetical protein